MHNMMHKRLKISVHFTMSTRQDLSRVLETNNSSEPIIVNL